MRIFSSILLLSASLHAESLTDAFVGTYNGKALQEARRKVLSTHEKTVQARAEFRPTVTASATANRSRVNNSGYNKDISQPATQSYGTSKTDTITQQGQVQVTQNIFKGGSSVAAVSGIDNQIRSAWAELSGTEQKAFADMAKLFCDILAKIKEIEFFKANNDFLTKQFESTHDKFKVGEETITNVSSAEADLAGGLASLQSAEAELEGFKAQYESIVGKKPHQFEKPSIPTFLPKALDEALKYARENHPDIVKASYDMAATQDDKDKFAGQLLPKVDVSASSTRTESQTKAFKNQPSTLKSKDYNTNNSVQVQMSIPLYEGGTYRSQIREAHEKSEAARIAIEKARLSVDASVIAAWQTFKAAEANLKNYQKQVEARALTVQSTQQEKEAGSKTLVDVLKAQKDLLDAQRNFVNSEKQYYLTAYQLASAVGMLNAEKLALPVDVFKPEQHFEETKWQF